MTGKCWRSVVVVTCLLSALILAGCKGPQSGDGNGWVDPDVLEGDIRLNERGVLGTRIEGLNFRTVLFEYDSFQLRDSELSKIEEAADYMRRNRNVLLVNEGHCDERGSREYNMSLGEHRALAVRAHLVGMGIEGSRIQTKSYGEEYPVDPGHNEAAWRTNRRVEFALYRP